MDSFQQILFKLKKYWADRGCIIQEPYDVEVGAGTMCPETFLRVLGPKPYRVAYVQPSRRPADGRYGENPNRLYKHSQLQVILKPSPDDVMEQYLGSLEAIGIDLRKHDIKFEEDNWESPTLGAWGIGWQVMLDGLEITQFTYFQQCGGIDLDLVPAELTYGLERLAAFLQGAGQRLRHRMGAGLHLRRRALRGGAAILRLQLRDGRRRRRCGSCSICTRRRASGCSTPTPDYAEKQRFPLLPAYDQVLKCSHLFNLLDSRGAISVTERVGVIARVRKLAVGRGPGLGRSARPGGGGMKTLPFLLEIGTEEIPDWMIQPALKQLARVIREVTSGQHAGRQGGHAGCHAAAAGAAAEGIPRRQPEQRGTGHRPAEVGWRRSRRRIRQEVGRRRPAP